MTNFQTQNSNLLRNSNVENPNSQFNEECFVSLSDMLENIDNYIDDDYEFDEDIEIDEELEEFENNCENEIDDYTERYLTGDDDDDEVIRINRNIPTISWDEF